MRFNFLLITIFIIVIQFPAAYAKDPSPEQLVEEHLKSIGEPEALSEAKSTSFAGTAEYNLILGQVKVGVPPYLIGTSMLVSQGSQMGIYMKFPNNNYPGESVAYDGKSVTVHKDGGHVGPFINSYNKIMKNGLLGGVFSKSWPLLDIKSNRPNNMKVRKTRVQGTELYELEYGPRDSYRDMIIRLYFDPETYRHVLTEYKILAPSGREMSSLTENFWNFKKVGSLTLPHGYSLSIASGGTMASWKINVQEIAIDTPNIPQNLFKAE